jgi:hypothetical protein
MLKSKNKKKDNNNDLLFILSIINNSYIFNTSFNKTNKWLININATNYITYNKFKFLTYINILEL